MSVPEVIDLSWAVLILLGSGAVGVFLLSWRLFNLRNADHVATAANLAKVKFDLEKLISENHSDHGALIENKYSILDERITRNREDLIDKIEGKCLFIKKDIERNERDNDEQYKELHGRMNQGTDELSEVKGELREVRGEHKVISIIVMDGIKR